MPRTSRKRREQLSNIAAQAYVASLLEQGRDQRICATTTASQYMPKALADLVMRYALHAEYMLGPMKSISGMRLRWAMADVHHACTWSRDKRRAGDLSLYWELVLGLVHPCDPGLVDNDDSGAVHKIREWRVESKIADLLWHGPPRCWGITLRKTDSGTNK